MPHCRRLAYAAFGLCLTAGITASQPPTLPTLLGAAASYVASYEERVSYLVFDEDYVQRVQSLGAAPAAERRLRSEVAVVNTPYFGWIGFRDVLEVDGKPVGNRQGRLQELFAHPLSEEAVGRAQAIAAESARFNLGSVLRTVNYPTMALVFLREANQQRSTFARQGSARVSGVITWIVEFQETQRPGLIASPTADSKEGEVRASGRFWIEPERGRVQRSQLTLEHQHSTGQIDVEYVSSPNLDVLVPSSMRETFSVQGLARSGDQRPMQIIRGEAKYSNVRQFTVDTTDKVRRLDP